jgi:hypothetical protein
MDFLGRAGEVRMNFEAIEVAHHKQWRVLERLAVVVQLLVGGREILALALVLPAEMAALPNVGEAVTAVEFLRAFLKRIPLAACIGFVWRGIPQHPA